MAKSCSEYQWCSASAVAAAPVAATTRRQVAKYSDSNRMNTPRFKKILLMRNHYVTEAMNRMIIGKVFLIQKV